MQLPPPVDVMRTVLAVIEPLVAAGPKAETQSPTASAPEVTDWVVWTVVELDVVTLRVSVLGFAGCWFLLLDLPGVKLPGDSEMPEMVSVDPSMAVTLPDATSKFANCVRKFFPAEPLPGTSRAPPSGMFWGPPPPSAPPRNRNPPAGGPPEPVPGRKVPGPFVVVQVLLPLGVDKVMLRAAMVVFDFFDANPVAVTQSPTATALTDSVTLLENVVVAVQLTVVWPLLGSCTSMLDALSAATLPIAAMGLIEVVAAPAAPAEALEPSIPAASRVAAPVPRRCARPLLGV